MSNFKFGIDFEAIDNLSGKLSNIARNFQNLGTQIGETSSKLSEIGEGLQSFGEKLLIDALLMKERAEQMREMSDAMTEPAFAMQKSMATMTAMTDLHGEEIDELKAHAIEFQNTHAGVTTEQWADGFTRMREIFQDTNKAMAAEDTVAMLSRFGVAGEAATNLFGAAFQNLGVEAKTVGDQFYGMIKAWGVAPDQAQQFARTVGLMGGTLKATNTPLAEALSLVGEARRQFGGGGGGATAFATMMNQLATKDEIAIYFTHDLARGLAEIKTQLAGMPEAEKLRTLKDTMAVSNPGALLNVLDHLGEIADKQREIANSGGALGKGFGIATDNATVRVSLLHQNMDSLYDSVGSPAVPTLTALVQSLQAGVQRLSSFLEAHPVIGKYLVTPMADAGYGISELSKGISAVGSTAMFGGMAMKFFGKSAEAFNFANIASGVWKLASAINPVTIATKLWTGAMGLLDAAMDANPIGVVILGAAALVAVGYEIYEHWNGIKSLFERFGNWMPDWAKKGRHGGADRSSPDRSA